jgi:tellurium resistance protein TerZ
MSISLAKKTGINLTKGSSISLIKDGKDLKNIQFGLNWGKIVSKEIVESSGIFGFFKSKEEKVIEQSVDLDGSVTAFDESNVEKWTVYYSNKKSPDNSIIHSGDDTTGDSSEDDFDNETISIDLTKIKADIKTLFIYLNSFKGQHFGEIPYSKVRIIETNNNTPVDVLASFNMSADSNMKEDITIILGKLVREKTGWKFYTIGETTKAKGISETIKLIKTKYL